MRFQIGCRNRDAIMCLETAPHVNIPAATPHPSTGRRPGQAHIIIACERVFIKCSVFCCCSRVVTAMWKKYAHCFLFSFTCASKGLHSNFHSTQRNSTEPQHSKTVAIAWFGHFRKYGPRIAEMHETTCVEWQKVVAKFSCRTKRAPSCRTKRTPSFWGWDFNRGSAQNTRHCNCAFERVRVVTQGRTSANSFSSFVWWRQTFAEAGEVYPGSVTRMKRHFSRPAFAVLCCVVLCCAMLSFADVAEVAVKH